MPAGPPPATQQVTVDGRLAMAAQCYNAGAASARTRSKPAGDRLVSRNDQSGTGPGPSVSRGGCTAGRARRRPSGDRQARPVRRRRVQRLRQARRINSYLVTSPHPSRFAILPSRKGRVYATPVMSLLAKWQPRISKRKWETNSSLPARPTGLSESMKRASATRTARRWFGILRTPRIRVKPPSRSRRFRRRDRIPSGSRCRRDSRPSDAPTRSATRSSPGRNPRYRSAIVGPGCRRLPPADCLGARRPLQSLRSAPGS